MLALVSAEAVSAADAQTGTTDLAKVIGQGAPILELRPRYEGVSQTGRPNDGEAVTLRTRLGWQTGRWANLQGLIEFEDVRSLAAERYDSGLNGKAAYAPISDPEVTELNRLQLTWTPSTAFTAVIGRQRINLDDQRFIGGVAWRQDEQTFDAVRLNSHVGDLETTYIYIAHVNRIFGEAQDWRSDSHILNASYAFGAPLRVSGFVYALDFNRPQTIAVGNQSNLTWGAKASGNLAVGRYTFDYAIRFARQSDYGSSRLNYALGEQNYEAAITRGRLSAKINYEKMEGDGARGFSTPLATLHSFNGWSDAFLANGVKTTVDGLRDFNLSISWSPVWKAQYLSGFNILVRRHEFEADRTGADLGAEWDASVGARLTPRLTWLVKYADYNGPDVANAPADRTKLWLQFEWKL